MPITIQSADVVTHVPSIAAMLDVIDEDVDIGPVLDAFRAGEKVQVRLKDGTTAILGKVPPTPDHQPPLSLPPPAAQHHETYEMECQVFVPVDVLARCRAPGAASAQNLVAQAFRGVAPRPGSDLEIEVDNDILMTVLNQTAANLAEAMVGDFAGLNYNVVVSRSTEVIEATSQRQEAILQGDLA